MGKRISKPTYYDEDKDKDLLEWLKTKGAYAGFVRLLITDLYNKEHGKPSLIFQQPQIPNYILSQGQNVQKSNPFAERIKALSEQKNKNNVYKEEG